MGPQSLGVRWVGGTTVTGVEWGSGTTVTGGGVGGRTGPNLQYCTNMRPSVWSVCMSNSVRMVVNVAGFYAHTMSIMYLQEGNSCVTGY